MWYYTRSTGCCCYRNIGAIYEALEIVLVLLKLGRKLEKGAREILADDIGNYGQLTRLHALSCWCHMLMFSMCKNLNK